MVDMFVGFACYEVGCGKRERLQEKDAAAPLNTHPYSFLSGPREAALRYSPYAYSNPYPLVFLPNKSVQNNSQPYIRGSLLGRPGHSYKLRSRVPVKLQH